MERERARLKQLIESRVFRGARSKGKRCMFGSEDRVEERD